MARLDPRQQERTPLLTQTGRKMLHRLREHPDAPLWNYAVGDRLLREDVRFVERFREELETGRGLRDPSGPSDPIRAVLEQHRSRVPYFCTHLPPSLNLARDWSCVPTSCRRDLASAPWEFVPSSLALDRLVIYRTAGTTGHPIEVPHHPRGIGCYIPLVEHALARHGVKIEVDGHTVACFLISAQVKTYTYSTVLSAWGGAGFAKVNLRATEWRQKESAHRYFADLAPRLITGEPVSFSELLRMGVPARAMAFLSTSVALSAALRRRLSESFDCPVIDWYSLVETGPIGYACPNGHGFHLLPHDLHIEALREDGSIVSEGERGEIAVSGGRNLYLPLLRYRTGDWGRIVCEPCACGDQMPRIMDLEGRNPVIFRAQDHTPVGNVDLSRLLREFPLLRHVFTQREDKSCELVACVLPGHVAPDVAEIERALRTLMGDVPIEVRMDPGLGDEDGAKLIPYRSAFSGDP